MPRPCQSHTSPPHMALGRQVALSYGVVLGGGKVWHHLEWEGPGTGGWSASGSAPALHTKPPRPGPMPGSSRFGWERPFLV